MFGLTFCCRGDAMFFCTGSERVRKSSVFLAEGEWNLSGLGVR